MLARTVDSEDEKEAGCFISASHRLVFPTPGRPWNMMRPCEAFSLSFGSWVRISTPNCSKMILLTLVINNGYPHTFMFLVDSHTCWTTDWMNPSRTKQFYWPTAHEIVHTCWYCIHYNTAENLAPARRHAQIIGRHKQEIGSVNIHNAGCCFRPVVQLWKPSQKLEFHRTCS